MSCRRHVYLDPLLVAKNLDEQNVETSQQLALALLRVRGPLEILLILAAQKDLNPEEKDSFGQLVYEWLVGQWLLYFTLLHVKLSSASHLVDGSEAIGFLA